MANILICPDIMQENGHWRPVMALALKLKSAPYNHSVMFMGIPDCKDIVSGYFDDSTFTSIWKDIYPYANTSMSYELSEFDRPRTLQIKKIIDGSLDSIITTFNPTLFLAGYFICIEALFMHYKYPSMKTIITTTYLRHPSDDPAMFALRFLASLPQEMSSSLMKQVTNNDPTFDGTMESIKKFVQPLDSPDYLPNPRPNPIPSFIDEIIFCPKEIDFKYYKHRSNTMYAESSILGDKRSSSSIISTIISTIVPAITTVKPYIYITAGSRVRDYQDSARTLFKTAIDAIDALLNPGCTLKLVVGYTLKKEIEDYANSKLLGNRIKIIDWANQIEILKNAKCAIIHGGLATIKECIMYNVPFVVVPLGKDQKDNSIRIYEAEIGKLLAMENVNTSSLYKSVSEVLSGGNVVNKRLKMKALFEKYENVDHPGLNKVLDCINN